MVEPSSTYCEKGCFAEPFQADSKTLSSGQDFIIVEKSSLSKWGVAGSEEMRVDWLVFIERGSQRLRGTKLNNFQNKASSESNQSSARQIVDSNRLECRSRHCSLWIVVITQREVTRPWWSNQRSKVTIAVLSLHPHQNSFSAFSAHQTLWVPNKKEQIKL